MIEFKDNNRCWCCGKVFNTSNPNSSRKKTGHHAIPRALRPKVNVIIPVCLGCHKLIDHNGRDFTVSFSQGVEMKVRKIKKELDRFSDFLDKFNVEENEE